MSEVQDVESEFIQDMGGAGDPSVKLLTHKPVPLLRVDVLKDEDGHSSSGTYGSEEEGVSHGEGSDIDAAGSPKSQLPEFVPPDDELKDRIIKQVGKHVTNHILTNKDKICNINIFYLCEVDTFLLDMYHV